MGRTFALLAFNEAIEGMVDVQMHLSDFLIVNGISWWKLKFLGKYICRHAKKTTAQNINIVQQKAEARCAFDSIMI